MRSNSRKLKEGNESFQMRKAHCKGFTLIEMMMVVVVMSILVAMLGPSLMRAKKQAKFTRWFAFNRNCSNDPDCCVNFNFQDNSGTILRNSAQGTDADIANPTEYNGVFCIAGSDNPDDSNLEWVPAGRFCRDKKALRFPGDGSYVNVKGIEAVDFTPADSFTVSVWVKFNNGMYLGEGLFGKCLWGVNYGSHDTTSLQYDLYCDPTAGSSGQGAFEVDVFTECFGWNSTDVQWDDTSWVNVVMRYQPGAMQSWTRARKYRGKQSSSSMVRNLGLRVRQTTPSLLTGTLAPNLDNHCGLEE